MSYGVKYIVEFLERKLGKRVGKQILYVILMVFGIERKRIKEALGASDVTLSKYGAVLKMRNWRAYSSKTTITHRTSWKRNESR